MRLLLDTHAVIWFLRADERLSERALTALQASGNEAFVSDVSLFETAIKKSIGKLDLGLSLSDLFTRVLADNGWQRVGLQPHHLPFYVELPLHHRAPPYRMLVAQAQAERLTLVSSPGTPGSPRTT